MTLIDATIRIRWLMIAVAVFACVIKLALVLPSTIVGILLLISATFLGPIALLIVAGYPWKPTASRRRAARWALVVATVSFVMKSMAAVVHAPCDFTHFLFGAVVLLPYSYIVAGIGIYWARQASDEGVTARLTRGSAYGGLLVLYLGLIGPMIQGRLPLQLAFAISESALSKIADDVQAGRPVSFPINAGLYQITGERHEPGSVVLHTHGDPTCGFVRSLNPQSDWMELTPIYGAWSFTRCD